MILCKLLKNLKNSLLVYNESEDYLPNICNGTECSNVIKSYDVKIWNPNEGRTEINISYDIFLDLFVV